MSILTKRMLAAVFVLLGLGGSALALSGIVDYKPWGVHDVQRPEYEAALEKIDFQEKVRAEPRPISKFLSFENPNTPQIPGTSVESIAVVANRGEKPLIFTAPDTWPANLEPLFPFPAQIEPQKELTLRFSWIVPARQSELKTLAFELTSNDPLQKVVRVEPNCRIAEAFLLNMPTIEAADTSNSAIQGVNYLFSQRYVDFVVSDIEADARLAVDIEPLVDPVLLEQANAKSGVKITVTDPPGRKRGSYSLPITFTASSGDYSETISFLLNEKRRSNTAFYGPELDVKEGLFMGVVEQDSDSAWNFFARIDRKEPLTDVVIEVVPNVFDAEVVQARKGSSDYRVTLRLKKDASPVDFQSGRRGYVKLTSETDPSVENWIPISGVVIPSLGNR